jgi:NMD protein affecting ribosome stability and mRNA decay
MKPARTHPVGARHEQRMNAARDDSYRDTEKHADPATCPRCRATYVAGRWMWSPAPAGAARTTCPACQRIEDNFPAGYVTLKGGFLAAHRDEVLNLVMRRAERARAEHPLQRIIGMQDTVQGVLVTTTDGHLARGLGIALQEAFKGDLDLTFSRDENLVRATWSRRD